MYIRKRRDKWQSIAQVKGHPKISKCFVSKTDAKRWSNQIELKLRREDGGIAKIKYPLFNEIGLRYIADVSSTKRGFINEINIIKSLMKESWSVYPINKITPDVIGKFSTIWIINDASRLEKLTTKELAAEYVPFYFDSKINYAPVNNHLVR